MSELGRRLLPRKPPPPARSLRAEGAGQHAARTSSTRKSGPSSRHLAQRKRYRATSAHSTAAATCWLTWAIPRLRMSRLRWSPSLSGGIRRADVGVAYFGVLPVLRTAAVEPTAQAKSSPMLSSRTSPTRWIASYPLGAERQSWRQVLQNPAPGQVPMCSRDPSRRPAWLSRRCDFPASLPGVLSDRSPDTPGDLAHLGTGRNCCLQPGLTREEHTSQ